MARSRRSVLAGIGGVAAWGVLPTGPAAPGGATSAAVPAVSAAPRTPGAIAATPAPARLQLSPKVLSEPPAAGAWIELSRSAVAANVAAVRAASGGRPIMGVIKANAYGHGLVPMARELERAGVEALMVITVEEALALRDAGLTLPVLNYGPFDADAAEQLVRRDVDQAVYTADAVARMAAAARRAGKPARLQIVFDTGLGRIGVPEAGVAELFTAIATAQAAGDIDITGAATALTEDTEFDRVQLGRYLRLCEQAPGAGIDVATRHVASSAAIIDYPDAHLDMVRPGITLYGHYPNERSLQQRPLELTPVLSLRARVAYVKTLQPGDSIGYHRAWVAERETTVATLPLGHSEGYPAPALAAGGAVAINGFGCPLIGGITSNHLEVSVPPGAAVDVGDVATLIAGGAAELSGAGAPLGAADAMPGNWLPTAPQVGAWGGAGVYGTLMHLSPLLPRLVS
jgi:alanine racemase